LHPTQVVEAIGDAPLNSEQQRHDEDCVFASDGVSVRVARFLFHDIKRISRIHLSAAERASEFRFQRTKIK
jgi:hypothetical protein